MTLRLSALLLLNSVFLMGISHRYVGLRDAWRSHNMALAAWEILERDQLDRSKEIFGEGFIMPPTNTLAP